jgi:hypothetical protein
MSRGLAIYCVTWLIVIAVGGAVLVRRPRP